MDSIQHFISQSQWLRSTIQGMLHIHVNSWTSNVFTGFFLCLVVLCFCGYLTCVVVLRDVSSSKTEVCEGLQNCSRSSSRFLMNQESWL